MSKGLVDPVTGTKIDRKTGLPTAYVNELNKKSSIINPVTRDFKGTFVQQLSDLQQPGATDYEASLPSGEKIKMTGVSPIPSEVIKEVVKKQSEDAAINTLNNLYEKRGKKFNKNSLEGQKEIQDYIDKENNGELSKAIGNFDGKPYLVRGRGFFESGVRGVLQSAMDPILYTDINSTFNPSDLADKLDSRIQAQGNIPESAPNTYGFYGDLAGGLPKMMGLLSIPYVGEAAMVTDMYQNGMAMQKMILYQKGLSEGLDRITAAEKAMKAAPMTAIPEALVGLGMAKGVGIFGKNAATNVSGNVGKNIIPLAEKETFKTALSNAAKSTTAITALGAGSGVAEGLLEREAGYKVSDKEILDKLMEKGKEYLFMDLAFKGAHGVANVPAYLKSASKNLLSTIPPEILEVQAEQYPYGQEVLKKVQDFSNVKNEIKGLVPEEKIASVAGLTEKVNNIQEKINTLNKTKSNTPEALQPVFDNLIKSQQEELGHYNEQIKKVLESKDPTGILEEIDEITGEKAGTSNLDLPAKQRPSFIPIENVEAMPAEELIRKQQEAPVIKGQQEVVPEQIDLSNFLESVKNKPIEELKMVDDINKANVTVEGTRNGYEVISGEGDRVGDIRQEASEARAKGQDTFTKETVKDGKKIYTLTDATVSDNFGRPGFKSASISFPEGTKVTMEDVMPRLKSELGIKAEVKPAEVKAEVKPGEVNSLQKSSEKVQDILGLPKEKADVLSLIYNSDKSNTEKKILYRQYERGVMTVEDIRKMTTLDSEKLASGDIDKWAKAILEGKKGDKSQINAESIEFEELPKKEVKPTEEKGLTMKGVRSLGTKKINEEASKIIPNDARSAALKYLTGAKLSEEAINEVAGRVKGPRLNTGERELKSEEARLRDYVAKKGEGESLEDAAHSIWDNLSEEMQSKMDTKDVKNALMEAILENKTKSEAAKALVEGYKEESLEDQEAAFYRRYNLTEKEVDAELALAEESLSRLEADEYDFKLPEEHVNNLIKQYETETQGQAKQLAEGIKEKNLKEISTRETSKPEKSLEKAYKDLTNIEKRQIINSKFDKLLEELKIEKICPTD